MLHAQISFFFLKVLPFTLYCIIRSFYLMNDVDKILYYLICMYQFTLIVHIIFCLYTALVNASVMCSLAWVK